jgi:N-acetylglucosamine kinase-like BadF-type ATPase
MKYIIGIDGGGTKTSCVFADESGKPVYETTGGPANFLIIGTDKAASNILSAIQSGLRKLDSSVDNISIILCGAAGAGRKHHSESLKDALSKKLPERIKIFVESDARIALEGALAGEPGAIMIAGTGSVIFGKDHSGKIFRAGGYGRLIGDEGSGHSIGAGTLNLISKMIDGREAGGEMLQDFNVIFHINNEDDLINLVHNPGFDIPSIAMFTIKSAEKGIPEAERILDQESEELIKHITAIKNKLNLMQLKLVLIGSLVENSNYYSNLLIKKINRLESVTLTKKQYPPEMGAVLMAKKILSENHPSQ